MTQFQRTIGSRFSEWPRWVCGSIDPSCGHVCNLPATKIAPWDLHGQILRVYCDACAPPDATAISSTEPFATTRLELRVAIASLPGLTDHAAADALRLATYALQSIGGVVIGVQVAGRKHVNEPPSAPPLRLELAGPPEGRLRADSVPWGELDSPERHFHRRRRTG